MSGGVVVFVQPPVSFDNSSPCLDDKQFGLGILANAAWLEKHGFAISCIHIPLLLHGGATARNAIELIVSKSPLLVAIGLNWVHFSQGAIETARRLRAISPGLPIVIGGQHAGIFAEEIAAAYHELIDGVICGEAELPLLRIASALQARQAIPQNLAGLYTGRVSPPVPEVVEEIDSLPVYSYRHMEPPPLQPDVAALSTARGTCPYRCAWCIEPVVGRIQGRAKLHFHSADRIVDQIEFLQSEGINRFTIQDNFFVGRDRNLFGLAEALVRRHVRPDHLNIFAHPESFTSIGMEALAACCQKGSLDYGIETGSVRVAERNNRRLDPDEVVDRIVHAVKVGLEPYSWWMAGLPGEDDAALAETEQLIALTMSAGGIPRWVSPLILFPQTEIHRNPKQFGVRTLFRTFSDYARFSEITLAEALLFSESITHETAEADRDGITAAALRLRHFIVNNLYRLETAYANAQYKPDVHLIEARIRQSFL